MLDLRGLATGIGSLPHKDVEAALDLIFRYVPEIPFWPQLPKRDNREGMVTQFSENFPGLVSEGKDLILLPEERDKKLEEFYEKITAQEREYFRISRDFAEGLYAFHKRLLDKPGLLATIKAIKCQITGPFTFAASIKDESSIALLHNPILMQVITEGLIMKALWQVERFKNFGKKIIMFVDEPYLGCFGSAYTPINREDVVAALTELTQRIKSEDVLVGLHCCGNTDWSIFTEITSIDIISFDAYSFLDKVLLYADNLKSFFKRGGILCWGIVPTQEFSGRETTPLLIKTMKEGFKALIKKGVPEEAIINNLLVSPSCGLGTLDTDKTEKIFKLLSETSLSLKK